MANGTKMFTIDQFLGVNEAMDGYTELKMGQASRMENFQITEGMNLALRPGVQRVDFAAERDPQQILGSWAGYITENSQEEHLCIVDFDGTQDRVWLYARKEDGHFTAKHRQDNVLGLKTAENHMVKLFAFCGRLYIMSREKTVYYENGSFREEEPYIPLVVAGAAPAGGGTNLENINLLTNMRRVSYSADGTSTAYVLPAEATGVTGIVIDNVSQDITQAGQFQAGSHAFQFKTAPVKGVGNVEITYSTDKSLTDISREAVLGMPLVEAYNGSTDTRLFVGGKGNVCYYTGVPNDGTVTPTYFPALYEVAVDMTGASVTGLVRHYGKLMVFTRDGTYTIDYAPVTLSGGGTTAGFYLRPANREFGHDVVGQIQTVNNYPRSITENGIYEWRVTSKDYQSERYAVRISDMVKRTLKGADVSRIVTCSDALDKSYYVFLNDSDGTVLVNRYGLNQENVWFVYKGQRFRGVTNAFTFGKDVVFTNDKEIFRLYNGVTKDASPEPGGQAEAIPAVWESGYMDFGADFQRKSSRQIYVSLLPDANTTVYVTAETDRRETYDEKAISQNLFTFDLIDFQNFSFLLNRVAKINRIRLKAKKFVYYKLIFRVHTPGARATILGCDLEVQYGAMAK